MRTLFSKNVLCFWARLFEGFTYLGFLGVFFNNNNLQRPDVFLGEGIMFKVSANPGLNLTHLRTIGPWPFIGIIVLSVHVGC